MQTRLTWIAAGVWVTACGPAPPERETAGEQTSTSSTTSSTGDPSPTGPDEPEPTSTTSETGGTSEPIPECQSDADCDGFCEYCVEGECYDAVGCCGLAPGPSGALELRCQGYECYADDECDEGHFCEAPGWCRSIAAIPTCERLPLTLSEPWLQGSASALALVDVDGDAALDVVALLPDAGAVEVLLGDGLGGFAPGETFPTDLLGGTQSLAVADFNGDGAPDLAVSRAAPVGELSLLFGQDAMFAAPVKDSLGATPGQLWSGDFDGDGKPDLLARGADPAQPIALRLGDGMGGFGEPFGAALRGVMFASWVGAVSGDPAKLDLLATGASGPAVDVFELVEGQGLGPIDGVVAPGIRSLDSVVAGDIDGDGETDLIGHRKPPPELDLLTIWSLGQPMPDMHVEGGRLLGPVADVDGDGAGDVLIGGAGAVRVLFVAGGDGPCVQTLPFSPGTTPQALAAGDVDGDGRADVVAAAPALAEFTLLRTGP
ncbi:Repeat domain-containing protein [Nannocystis exedens]|uniref:Repeat domain-containing protein n=1 Tax=Nannocystis exedens TaxID=54 RepID=A0A1I2B214_9BACT|nr:VCBS repeat-containing protein [Nannocystis exedens]PCC74410.1 FG-GAP repeat protein [Nannocystis exedens]SFE49948.1 Repeat domain-containing protein [Nannocystis exedens]